MKPPEQEIQAMLRDLSDARREGFSQLKLLLLADRHCLYDLDDEDLIKTYKARRIMWDLTFDGDIRTNPMEAHELIVGWNRNAYWVAKERGIVLD